MFFELDFSLSRTGRFQNSDGWSPGYLGDSGEVAWGVAVYIANWCLEGSDLELEYPKIPFITGSDLELLPSFQAHLRL